MLGRFAPFRLLLVTAALHLALASGATPQIQAPPVQPVFGGGTGSVDPNAALVPVAAPYNHEEDSALELEDQDRVILASGEIVVSETDFVLRGRGMDLEWKRTYRSRIQYPGPLGESWTFRYNVFLKENGNSVTYVNPDGKPIGFYNQAGGYVGAANVFLKLTKLADGSFTLKFPSSHVYRFSIPNAQGHARLDSITDQNENTLGFAYDASDRLATITDTLGRVTTLGWYSSGRLSSVTDPSGRTWSYGYDAANDLRIVHIPATPDAPGGYQKSYTYSTGFTDPLLNHDMLAATWPAGARFQNTFDAADMLATHTRGYGDWSFVYGTGSTQKVVSVTDRNGNLSDWTIGVPTWDVLSTRRYANRGIDAHNPASWLWTNSATVGGVLTTNYPDGRTLVVRKDASNADVLARSNVFEERLMAVAGSGLPDRVRRTIHDAVYNEPMYEVEPRAFPNGVVPLSGGQLNLADPLVQRYTTRHWFDYEEISSGNDLNGDGLLGPDHGNVVRTDLPTATVHGQAFSADPPQPAVRTFVYNSRGQIIQETDENGSITRHYYWPASDPIGALAATQPVSDLTTLCGYEAKVVRDWSATPGAIDFSTGQPYLNLATVKRYDARGNVTALTDPRGNTTTRAFDALGRMTSETAPAPIGAQILRNYDGNGFVTKVKRQNLLASGAPDAANPWLETRYTWNAVGSLTEIAEERAEGVFVSTKVAYDKNDNRVLVVTPLATSGVDHANVTSYVYDELDHLHASTSGGTTSQWKGLAAHAHISLSALGVADSPLIGTQRRTSAFDATVVRAEDEVGHVATMLLDGHGLVATEYDGAGNSTVTGRDLVENETSVETHDASGALLSLETRIYDERSRLVETNKPFFVVATGAPIALDGNADGVVTTSARYDPAGRSIAHADDVGRITTMSYDGAGRRHLRIDPAGNQTEWVHDANGNDLTTIQRDMVGGSLVTYAENRTFDVANRVITASDARGKVTTFERNSRGLVTKTIDPLGNETIDAYDDRGRRLTSSRPLHTGGIGSGAVIGVSTVTQVFDDNDNLLEIRDGQNATTSYDYDARNRMQQAQRPGEPPVVLVYNADGTVQYATDQNGTVVVFGYDGAGRLQSKTVAPASGVDAQTTFETWSFDGAGRIKTATNDLGTITRNYDSLGNILDDAFGGLQATQSLDGTRNVVAMSYPTPLQVTFDIDPLLDQTLHVNVNGSTYFGFVYDGDSRLATRTTTPPGGAAWDLKRSYDGGKRLTTHRHKKNGTSAITAGWNYGYFDSNAIATIARSHQNLNGDQFFYDSTYQETRVQKDVPRNQLGNPQTTSFGSYFDYVYDLAGNRLLADANGTTTAYAPNALQQYSTVGGVSFLYDSNGNLLSDGTRTFVYDYANRLVTVRQGATTLATYRYDALGRRYEKTAGSATTRAVWLDGAVVEERMTVGSSTSVRQFVWGRSIDELLLLRVGGVDYFPLEDHQMSVSHLLDAAGNVVESYLYDPYGKPEIYDALGIPIATSLFGNPALYAGRTWDAESGLYYNRARYYDPMLGRFLTRDPAGFAGGINLYAYVGNGPINGRDPSGMDTFKDLIPPPDEHGKNAAAATVTGGGIAVVVGFGALVLATGGLAAIIGGLAIAGGVVGIYSGVEWGIELSEAQMTQLGKNIDNFGDAMQTLHQGGQALVNSVGNKPGTYPQNGGITITVDKNGDKTITYPDKSSMTYHKDGTADGTDGRGDTVHVDKDGTITTTLQDGTTIVRHPDGSTTTTTPDGTVIETDRNGKITKITPKPKKEKEDKGKKSQKQQSAPPQQKNS